MKFVLVLVGPDEPGFRQLPSVLGGESTRLRILDLAAQAFDLLVERVDGRRQLPHFELECAHVAESRLALLLPPFERLRDLCRGVFGLSQFVCEELYFDGFQPVVEGFEGCCRFGLPRERLKPRLNLLYDVTDAKEVLLGLGEFDEGLALFYPVFAHSGRLFEEGAALLRAGAQDRFDLALTNDGERAFPQAGIEKELLDITQPTWRAVDEKLALPGAVYSPGYGDFGVIQGD